MQRPATRARSLSSLARLRTAGLLIAAALTLLVFASPASAPVEGQSVLLDFTAAWCGPCQQMTPIVSRLERQGYPVRQVDVDRDPQLASRFNITSIPAFVLVVDGKEVDRITGMTSESRLRRLLAKIPQRQPSREKLANSHKSQPRSTPPRAPQSLPPTGDAVAEAGETKPSFQLPWFSRPKSKSADELSRTELTVRANSPDAAPSPAKVDVMGASLRIRVRDAEGVNYGSGTLVDSRIGRSLVLTCGHIFRGLTEDALIEVDVFATGGQFETYVGNVVRYDLEADVGLIAIPTSDPLPISPVAGRDAELERGEAVFSIGCGGGEPPTREDLQVTALNRYLGPDNVECTGVPIQGRSGGGLFNPEGELVGVCIAADPRERRGLYAGLKAVQALLDKAELAHLYTPPAAEPQEEPPAASFANNPPQPTPSEPPAKDVPAAAPADRGAAEQLQQVLQGAPEAEVICIVRPIDERASSRVVILNRASPKFVAYLLDEVDDQSARQTASLRVEGKPASGPAPQPTASGTRTGQPRFRRSR